MPNASNKATKPQKRPAAASGVSRQHLFLDHTEMILLGTYRRLPEFRTIRVRLNDRQRERLLDAIKIDIPAEVFDSIERMTERLIEHELIIVRAPKTSDVIEEVRSICLEAISCLSILKKLQDTFNSADGGLGSPRLSLADAASGIAGPPDVRTAAVDHIKRRLKTPIPPSLDLGPLIQACYSIKDEKSSKTSSKGKTYLALFFTSLTNCIRSCGMKPTLPTKGNVEKNGSQLKTKFFDFVQAALLNVVEVAEGVLEGESFAESEKVATLSVLRQYSLLSNSQLLTRLRPIRNSTLPGLSAFVEAAEK
jgi:hypothetical protein